MWLLHFWSWFLERILKSLEKWYRQSIEHSNQRFNREFWWEFRRQPYETEYGQGGFQMGMNTLLVIGLEARHDTFKQTICLHFVLILRLCGRLNLKGMSDLSGRGYFEIVHQSVVEWLSIAAFI
jgi:hypothetical protein